MERGREGEKVEEVEGMREGGGQCTGERSVTVWNEETGNLKC